MAGELRKAILETDDIQTEIVPVPQWGDTKIEIRGMTSKERAKLLKSTSTDGEVNFDRWFPDLIIATAFDPDTGEKVFEAADRQALNGKSGAAISTLAEVASRLSGLGDTDVNEAKEELLEETPKPDST